MGSAIASKTRRGPPAEGTLDLDTILQALRGSERDVTQDLGDRIETLSERMGGTQSDNPQGLDKP